MPSVLRTEPGSGRITDVSLLEDTRSLPKTAQRAGPGVVRKTADGSGRPDAGSRGRRRAGSYLGTGRLRLLFRADARTRAGTTPFGIEQTVTGGSRRRPTGPGTSPPGGRSARQRASDRPGGVRDHA